MSDKTKHDQLVLVGNGEFYTAIKEKKACGETICDLPLPISVNDLQSKASKIVKRYNEFAELEELLGLHKPANVLLMQKLDKLKAENEETLILMNAIKESVFEELAKNRQLQAELEEMTSKMKYHSETNALYKSRLEKHHKIAGDIINEIKLKVPSEKMIYELAKQILPEKE